MARPSQRTKDMEWLGLVEEVRASGRHAISIREKESAGRDPSFGASSEVTGELGGE